MTKQPKCTGPLTKDPSLEESFCLFAKHSYMSGRSPCNCSLCTWSRRMKWALTPSNRASIQIGIIMPKVRFMERYKWREKETHKKRKPVKIALCPSFLPVFLFLKRPQCSVLSRNSNPKRSPLRLLIAMRSITQVNFRQMFSQPGFISRGILPLQGFTQRRKHTVYTQRRKHTVYTVIGSEGNGPWKYAISILIDRVWVSPGSRI